MKALVGAFNQEKAPVLVGAFSVIVKTGCGTDGSFYSTTIYISNTVSFDHLGSMDYGQKIFRHSSLLI